MPDETPVTPELEVPDPRPYIFRAAAVTALTTFAIHRLLKVRSNAGAWGAASALASEVRAPRRWTRAFSENDPFLAQLKDIAQTQVTPS